MPKKSHAKFASKAQHFKLPHYFSVTSLLTILVTVLILFFLSREASITLIKMYGESTNKLIYKAFVVNNTKFTETDFSQNNASLSSETHQTLDEVGETLTNTSVTCFVIYNPDKKPVFTRFFADQSSQQAPKSPPDRAFQDKSVFSEIEYADGLTLRSDDAKENNVVHTYFPLSNTQSDLHHGVINISTDIGNLVHETESKLRHFWFALIVILAFVYAALQLVIWHANRQVNAQTKIIRDNNDTLKSLSKRLFFASENERKVISNKLNEDIAQTLAALHLNLDYINQLEKRPVDSTQPPVNLFQLKEKIQKATDDISQLAMKIRPATIDDIGLRPTLAWLSRTYQKENPGIELSYTISVDEADLPNELAIVIYRICLQFLDEISDYVTKAEIDIMLDLVDSVLILKFNYLMLENNDGLRDKTVSFLDRLDQTSIKERVYLSDGSLRAERRPHQIKYTITWHI